MYGCPPRSPPFRPSLLHRPLRPLRPFSIIRSVRSVVAKGKTMCRNIRQLANFIPPATEDEVRAAALQFVRKVSGSTKPSKDNAGTFSAAVDEITATTLHMLAHLLAHSPPKVREAEAAKAKAKWQARADREAARAVAAHLASHARAPAQPAAPASPRKARLAPGAAKTKRAPGPAATPARRRTRSTTR